MQNFSRRHAAGVPVDGAPNSPGQSQGVAAQRARAASPPTTRFRLVRYFSLASFSAIMLFAAALLYFEHLENDFVKHAQHEQNAFFAQLQENFVQRHDSAASAYLLRVYEAANINLGRLFSNTMWQQEFAPFVAKTQRIPVDRCRAIIDGRDGSGKAVQPAEMQACYAEIGRKIVALPEFRRLDARVLRAMKKSSVFKIKVYDLRGITVYSSEHSQIGKDKTGDAGWVSAAAGKPASALTRRDQFSAFEGAVFNRDLIATYLPVTAPGSENIVGVFEIYSEVTPFLDQINSTSTEIRKLIAANRTEMERAADASREKVDANQQALLAVMLGTLAALYLGLYLIARNAQRVIDKQNFERSRVELALARQKDLYDALSQTNKAIVHMASREELFEAVCRIAVEHGRFRFAWVDLFDKDGLPLKPAAKYGEDAGYLDQLDIAGDRQDASKRGLTGRALLSNTYVISNDFLNDPATAPWREAGRHAGVQASAKFPIRQSGTIIGAISFYAGETGFFTEELIATLDEIARDVSFALDNFQREAERKEAVEALRESDARTQLLVESSNVGLWDWNLLTDEVYFSPQWKQHLGHADHELPNRYEEWESRLHPEDRERTLTAMTDFRDGRRADYDVEFRLLHKDSSWRWILTRADLIRDAAGRPLRMMGCHIDITERRRTDQALRDSERLLRESQSIAGLGSYVLDISAGRWSSSAILDGIFGIDDTYERSLAGWLSLIHPDWQDRMSHYFADEVLGKHVRFDREYQIIRKTDGEARWVHGLGELEFDAQGRPCRMIGTISDITERKLAEQALRAAESQFRSLVEQSIAGIYIIQDGKFVYVNPRMAQIHGYASEHELIDTDPSLLVAENDAAGAADIMRRLLDGSATGIDHNLSGRRKDGSTVELGLHSGRASYRGRPAVIGMMQDISEKKRADEQIRHYVAQLESAFMSTVEVATTLSEMRDPYTAGHERRVAKIAVAIGAELGFDARRQEGLRVAGYLHDIGKITIPSEILSKPGKLNPIEFSLIQCHPQASYDVLKDVEFPWLVADIALQHHERIDGSGYPQGLKGDAILLEARIIGVADVVEAMASHRPYRPGLGIEVALGEIERGRGTAYDPVVADACLKLFREKGYAVPA